MAENSDLIAPGTVIGDGAEIGHGVIIEENVHIGMDTIIAPYAVIRPNTVIGESCIIGIHTVLDGDVRVGDRVTIHSHCYVAKGANIEDDVFIGPGLCALNTKRIVHGRDYDLVLEPFRILRAARIGGGVTILPGVIIGENALVGAGSVVTKDIPSKQMWLGCPAQVFTSVPEDELL